MRPWFKAPRIQSPEMRQLRRVHGSLACFHLLVIIDLFSDIGAADIDAAFIVEYCKVKFKTAERWLPYFQNILLAFAKQNQNKPETKPKHNGNITETESKHNQNKTVLFDLKPSNSLIPENASLIEENRRDRLDNTPLTPQGGNGLALKENIGKIPPGTGLSLKSDVCRTGNPGSFERFWSKYPAKTAKKLVQSIWGRKKLDARVDEILSGLEKHLTSEKWKRGFIPNPSTFLNQERWLDEVESTESSSLPKPKPKHERFFEADYAVHAFGGSDDHPERIKTSDWAYVPKGWYGSDALQHKVTGQLVRFDDYRPVGEVAHVS